MVNDVFSFEEIMENEIQLKFLRRRQKFVLRIFNENYEFFFKEDVEVRVRSWIRVRVKRIKRVVWVFIVCVWWGIGIEWIWKKKFN